MVRYAVAALGALSLFTLAGCEKDKPTCMQGQMFDEATGQCMAMQPQCPAGSAWNGMQCAPMGTGTGGGSCPAGQMWNGSACVPAGGATTGAGGGGLPGGLGGASCTPGYCD